MFFLQGKHLAQRPTGFARKLLEEARKYQQTRPLPTKRRTGRRAAALTEWRDLTILPLRIRTNDTIADAMLFAACTVGLFVVQAWRARGDGKSGRHAGSRRCG